VLKFLALAENSVLSNSICFEVPVGLSGELLLCAHKNRLALTVGAIVFAALHAHPVVVTVRSPVKSTKELLTSKATSVFSCQRPGLLTQFVFFPNTVRLGITLVTGIWSGVVTEPKHFMRSAEQILENGGMREPRLRCTEAYILLFGN